VQYCRPLLPLPSHPLLEPLPKSLLALAKAGRPRDGKFPGNRRRWFGRPVRVVPDGEPPVPLSRRNSATFPMARGCLERFALGWRTETGDGHSASRGFSVRHQANSGREPVPFFFAVPYAIANRYSGRCRAVRPPRPVRRRMTLRPGNPSEQSPGVQPCGVSHSPLEHPWKSGRLTKARGPHQITWYHRPGPGRGLPHPLGGRISKSLPTSKLRGHSAPLMRGGIAIA
jgi:hypothetical protein